MKVTFSPAAGDDLMEIAIFIAQDNPARALSFVDEPEGKCTSLARAPGIGTMRPDLGQGIRMLPYKRYVIFYRDANKAVRIERILHGSRDIGGRDFDTSDCDPE